MSAFAGFGGGGEYANSPLRHELEVPGRLPDLRVPESDIQIALSDPDSSDLLHAWLQAEDEAIELDVLPPDDPYVNDANWRQGRVVNRNGGTKHRFEYRAIPPSRTSRAGARLLSVASGQAKAPMGMIYGRIVPDSASGPDTQARFRLVA